MASENNLQKKCGFCGEGIPSGARRCPYCGSILEVSIDNSYGMNQNEHPFHTGTDTGMDAQNQEPGQGAGQPADTQYNDSDSPASDAQEHTGQQSGNDPRMQNAYKPYGSGGYQPNTNYGSYRKEPLSNGMKVFLTALFTLVPGLGQLAGIIAAIVFMNSEGDSDRKSFGVALLVLSLVMFVLSCISCFVLVAAFSNRLNY